MQYRAAGLGAFGQGLGDLAQSYMGRGALEAKARREHERELASAYRESQLGRKAGFEANIAGDEWTARQGLGENMAVLLEAAGHADPRVGEALAGAYRASGGGAGALGDIYSDQMAQIRRNQAERAYGTDPARANFLATLGGVTTLSQPYQQSAQGSVLNQVTGAVQQDSPLARAALEALAAESRRRDAYAGAATELGALRARTDPNRARPGGGGKGGGLNASDINTLNRILAPGGAMRMLPSGEYYMEFGDPQAQARHEALVSRAAQIMSEEGVDHATAAVMAKAEYGFQLYDPTAPDPLRTGVPAPHLLPDPTVAQDPLGIRR